MRWLGIADFFSTGYYDENNIFTIIRKLGKISASSWHFRQVYEKLYETIISTFYSGTHFKSPRTFIKILKLSLILAWRKMYVLPACTHVIVLLSMICWNMDGKCHRRVRFIRSSCSNSSTYYFTQPLIFLLYYHGYEYDGIFKIKGVKRVKNTWSP